MKGSRKLYIKSFGCQMNVYDSQRMADTLARRGLCRDRDARLTPISSSSIPATSARRRPRRSIPSSAACASSRRPPRGEGRQVVVAVAGCVAQAEGAEIIRRAPTVDLVVGPQNYHRLPELLARAGRGTARWSTPSSRSRTSSTVCGAPSPQATRGARRLGLRHRAGGLRQVLHLLRRALYARRRDLAAGREDRRRGRAAGRRRRARDHADRAERQRLSRRGAGRASRGRWRGSSHASPRCPGIERLRYTTSHPRDMDGRA